MFFLLVLIGSGSVRSHGFFSMFGGRYDYEYDVPNGAIHVTFGMDDSSCNSLNLWPTDRNGNATLKWDKVAGKAYVHAWVVGTIGGVNRISWKVYAKVKT